MRAAVAIAVALGPERAIAAPTPEAADLAWARARQEDLPAWRARLDAARARTEARERFFSGDGSFAEAFPDLAGRALGDAAVLAGLLALRADEDAARAAARVAPLPELGAPARRDELERARQAALDAEDRAAALERRALSALRAQLDAHAALVRVDALRGPLRATIATAAAPGLDDATRAAREREAAAADAELARLDALLDGLRRVALVPAAAPPDPAPDLARLADPQLAGAAADRLRLVRPWLAPADRGTVDEALSAWLAAELDRARAEADAAAAPRAERADAAALQAERVALEARAAALQARREAPGDDPLAQAEQAVLAERLRGVEAALGRVQAALDGLGAPEQAPPSSEADAADARARAAEALAEARDDAERRAAEVLSSAAEARGAAAAAWEGARAAQAAVERQRAEAGERLAAIRTALAELRTAGLLDVARPDPDALFRELRGLLIAQRRAASDAIAGDRAARAAADAARTEIAAERVRLEAARRSLASAPDPARATAAAGVDQWAEALDDRLRAAAAAAAAAREALDDDLGRIREIHELREQVRPAVSADALREDRAHLLSDLGREASLLPARITARAREQAAAIRGWPARILDFNALRAVLFGSFWIVVVGVGWAALRRRADAIAIGAARRVATLRPELTFADLRGALRPLRHVIQTLLDLVVGWLVVGPVSAVSPELAVVLLVYLHVAVFRFVLAAFDLSFARHPSFRPALRTLQPDVHDRARRTVAWILAFVLVRRVGLLLLGGLGLHTAADLARGLLAVLAAVLVGGVAATWEPVLRAAMARRPQDRRVVAVLSQPPRHWLLAAPQAVVAFVLLAAAFVVGVLPRLAREGTQLGTLVTRLGTYGLAAGRSEGPHDRVPPEVAARIVALDGDAPPRTDTVDAVLAEIATCRARGGPGLVVVAGDAGEGKSAVLDTIGARLGEGATRVTLSARLRSEADAAGWLLQIAGGEAPADAEAPSSVDAAVEALLARPPTVWLVDDLHRAFLRVVGGFDAIRTVLHAVSATAGRHVWLATAHRPAWRHLSHLGALVDTAGVRRTVELPALGERELRALTVARARAAGVEPEFRSLVRPSVLGDDPAVELERATSLFYRLLAEQSDGNPRTALHLWVACLAPEAPGRARVVLDDVLHEQVSLTLHEMFVLGALRTHDGLTLPELVEVTNLEPARVRGLVQHLEARGLVRDRAGDLDVPAAGLAAVTRALVRKNAVQWG